MPLNACLQCGSADIALIEYSPDAPEHYDGISEIRCNACNVRIGRWSEKVLADGESEKRFGGM